MSVINATINSVTPKSDPRNKAALACLSIPRCEKGVARYLFRTGQVNVVRSGESIFI